MLDRRRFLTAMVSIGVSAKANGVMRLTRAHPDMLGREWSLPSGTEVEIPVGDIDGQSLPHVLAAISNWHIPSGAIVTLKLMDGIHDMPGTIAIRHIDGDRLRIVGNESKPSNCVLRWPAKCDGISADGTSLGFLNGVTLLREVDNNNGAKDNACGLVASDGGRIKTGRNVLVRGFYYGVQARRSGLVRCDGIQVFNPGDAGIFAYHGGHITAMNALVEGASDSLIGLGSGFVAEYGGTIDAASAIAKGNALAGFTALSSGSLLANRSRSENNARYGYYAITNGSIVAHNAIAEGNRIKAWHELEGGSVTGHGLK